MKNGTCKLCLLEKPLLNKSHIIPDFFYVQAGLYNEKHQIYKIDVQRFLERKHVSLVPTGIYEKGILCQNCDNHILGTLETYGRKVLFGGFREDEDFKLLNFKNPIDGFTYSLFENVNYKKFKLFLLSILWRSAISENDLFMDVIIPKNYVEDLREMILKGDPRKFNDFPIITMTYLQDKEVPAELIGQPIKSDTKNGILVTFLLTGFVFVFNIQNDYPDLSRIEKFTPTPDNKFGIMHLPEGQGWEFILKYTYIKK